jgi:hypothetical protein
MNCRNGHENPDDARFCQECGVSLQQQSAEEQAQEALQRLQTKQEEPQEVASDKTAPYSLGDDFRNTAAAPVWERWTNLKAPVQGGIIAAVAAIVVAIVIGVSAGDSDGSSSSGSSTDTNPAAPTVVMTASQLEGDLTSGAWTSGDTPSAASCVGGNVNSDGSGSYQCLVTFDGTQYSKQVTVSSDGTYIAG